ncbi:MAG: ABC transporter ATP-binding protein [Thermanaerothrix sp.]|nr:ABC transporter ATP-binding protein [Thermanaerothrix sp.]
MAGERCVEFRMAHSLGSFRIEASFSMGGESCVLFGPSGSGKSSLLRAMAGLLRPREGYMSLGGRVLMDTERGVFVPPEGRCVSLCFQSLALFPHMTALENVGYGVKGRGSEKRRRALEWLERVHMKGLEGRYPHQLSGGQRQRVALARALAAEPELLLLDEPFSALDGPLRRNLRREIRELQRETGIPMVYVTHNMDDVCALGDRVVIMRDGQVRGVFSAQGMWELGRSGEVFGALGWGNLLEGRLVRTHGGWSLESPFGEVFLGVREGLEEGPGRVFVSPEAVKPVYQDVPIQEDLRRNLFEGVVEEVLPLPSFVRLEVRSHRSWQVDVPRSSSFALTVREGMTARFTIPPWAVEVIPCSKA